MQNRIVESPHACQKPNYICWSLRTSLEKNKRYLNRNWKKTSAKKQRNYYFLEKNLRYSIISKVRFLSGHVHGNTPEDPSSQLLEAKLVASTTLVPAKETLSNATANSTFLAVTVNWASSPIIRLESSMFSKFNLVSQLIASVGANSHSAYKSGKYFFRPCHSRDLL